MSKNIDLGTFQWDSTKLTDQIAANYLELQRFSSSLKSTNDALKKTSSEIKILENKIEAERKTQERLNKALDEGYISQDEYNKQLAESDAALGGLVAEQQKAIKSQADYIIEVTKTQQEIKGLKQEQTELTKLMNTGKQEIDGSEGAYRAFNQKLVDAKLEAKNLGAQLYELGQRVGQNSDEYKQLSARYDEAATRADNLNNELKALDKSVGDNHRTVGDYKDQIQSAFSEITQGAMQLASGNVKEGFESMKAGFSGVMESAKGLQAFFLSNPYTAILVAVAAITAGIVAGAKEIFDYNAKIKEAVALTESLTGTSGKLADDIRVRAQALADTFSADFNEVIKTANTLAKQLGISYEEAFNKIEQGYVRGANASGDFLERLREYGPLLSKYGFDINEIIGLQIQAQEQGLFNDKFEDSLKEAGIALDEFTKAQADALTSAFGKSFADKISRDINSGTLTVKDALLLMGAEAKKQGLSVQQFGTLTADVFKGAGEDVGGARVIFENLYEGITKLEAPLTRAQQRTLELSKANYELAQVQDQALKNDRILDFQNDWEIAVTKVKTAWYNFVAGLMEAISWIDETFSVSENLFELYETGQEYVAQLKAVFDELIGAFSDLTSALGLNNSESKSFLKTVLSFFNPLNSLKLIYKGLIGVLQGVQTAIRLARVDAVAFVNTVKTVFTQLASAIQGFDISNPLESLKRFASINIAKTFADARKEATAAIKAQKELNKTFKGDTPQKREGATPSAGNASTTQADRDAAAKASADAAKKAAAEAKQAESKRLQEQKKAAEDAKRALEEETKRQLEIAKEAAEQKIDIAKNELAQYIALNADKYKDDKTLLQKKLTDQLAYLDEVKRLQSKATEEEYAAKERAIQIKVDELEKKKELNENDRNELANLKAEIEQLNIEYATKELELTNQTNEKKKELNLKYEQDVQAQKDLAQALDFQQRILDLEANHASEFEIRKAQLDQDTAQRLNQFLKENELKRELDQENYDTNAEIEAQRKELEAQIAITDDGNEKLRLSNKLTQLTQLEQEAAISRKQIDDAVTQSKIDGFATVFGMARQAFGEQTAVGKAAAIAETTINTYKAATSAYSSLAGIPIVGPALGAVAAGLAVVAGLKNVQKIVSTKDKFARGGIISGPSHANGGVPISTPTGMIEAEGGEAIINKNSTRMFARELSAINEAGGGKKIFAKGGVVSGSLAGVQNAIGGGQDFTAMTEAIQQAVADGSAQGTASGSQQGMENLNSNIKIQQGASF